MKIVPNMVKSNYVYDILDNLRTLANHYLSLRQILGHGKPGFDFDQ